MTPNPISIAGGIIILMAAAFLGLRELLLSDRVKSLPVAPFWVRTSMFVFMITLVYRGSDILMSQGTAHEEGLDLKGVVASACLAAYHFAMLCNVLSQRYPPEIWSKLYRIEKLAKCRRVGAPLVHLTLAGWTVWAPKERALPDNQI